MGWVNLDADLGYRWVIFACRFTVIILPVSIICFIRSSQGYILVSYLSIIVIYVLRPMYKSKMFDTILGVLQRVVG